MLGDKSELPITAEFLSKVKSHVVAEPDVDPPETASSDHDGQGEGQDEAGDSWGGYLGYIVAMIVGNIGFGVCHHGGCSGFTSVLGGMVAVALLGILEWVVCRKGRRK